jgi:molybdate transport system regulatory protein
LRLLDRAGRSRYNPLTIYPFVRVEDAMQPKSNLWIEKDGEVVLSRWRVNLLRAIDETGSISAAAEKMKVSYHRAWEKLHEMETRLGVSLVETQTGGEHGGGARLTATAHDYVARFEQFSQGIDETVARRFAQAFGPQ